MAKESLNCKVSKVHYSLNCKVSKVHYSLNCKVSKVHYSLNCKVSTVHYRLNCKLSNFAFKRLNDEYFSANSTVNSKDTSKVTSVTSKKRTVVKEKLVKAFKTPPKRVAKLSKTLSNNDF